jgi:hypothetical protein
MMRSACTLAFEGTVLLLLMSWNIQAQGLRVTLLGTGSPIPIIERFGRVLWSKQDPKSC